MTYACEGTPNRKYVENASTIIDDRNDYLNMEDEYKDQNTPDDPENPTYNPINEVLWGWNTRYWDCKGFVKS